MFAVLALLLLPALAGPGETAYIARCSICHAADGSGRTAKGKKLKLPDLASQEVQKQTDAQLFQIIAQGKDQMPGYAKELGEQKIRDLVAYIRELGKRR